MEHTAKYIQSEIEPVEKPAFTVELISSVHGNIRIYTQCKEVHMIEKIIIEPLIKTFCVMEARLIRHGKTVKIYT